MTAKKSQPIPAALNATRRGAMAGGLAAAALALSSGSTVRPSKVSGFVFHDRKRAGIRSGETLGIPGVLVSNGVDIVATDGDGRWSLPARVGEHVFVIKPTDWSYVRLGNGLPEFAHRIVTASLTRSIDFGLEHEPEPRTFDVALLADTQPQTMVELGYLRDMIMPAVVDANAAFAINHGDVVFDNPALHSRYLALVAATGMLWHHCPGNHDMDPGDPSISFETWKNTFGPCYYAFQHGGVTFLILNNVERLTDGALTAGGYDYRGAIGRNQLLFVEAVLRHTPPDQLVVVSMHIPLVGLEDPNEPASITADRQALLHLLSGRPNTLSLAGHTHTTEHHYLGAADGFRGPGVHHHHVLTAACGSWWSGPFDTDGQPLALSRDGTPLGIHILEIAGTTYRTRFMPAAPGRHKQVRLGLEGNEGTGRDDRQERVKLACSVRVEQCREAVITANVFDGGPRTTVTCTVSGRTSGEAIPSHTFALVREALTDVTVSDLYMTHRDQIKSWVEPAICSHLWRGSLPALARGTYTASLDITDEYGRQSRASLMFEIVT